MKNLYSKTILSILVMLVFSTIGFAQTTAFNYQGSLNSGGVAAAGSHDFEFALFDAPVGGSQLGSTITQNSVAVTNGIFAVSLDFGSQFPGANRFLEIRVRQTGGGAFTPLLPRQPVNSTPYAVKSVNADNATNAANATTATNAFQLGGVAADQYVVTTDSRMTNARTPTAGSANYIQNQNAGAQAESNFNINGTGTANILNAAMQYNIGNNRVLSVAGSTNVFAGIGAGSANTSAGFNNSFFGHLAGQANTAGASNSFFGRSAGLANTEGSLNSFFGRGAGDFNTIGGSNSFFGTNAGRFNTIGGSNSFFGASAGQANTEGSNNTMVGNGADVGPGNLTFATAIGAGVVVSTSNTIALGRSAGQDAVQIPGALSVTGALTANGSGLTNLNAGNIAAGTLLTTRGGTGLSASGTSGNFLRSNGTIWTSSAIVAADIPTGSANYVQNTLVQQATSNFNVSGNGTAGGTLSGNIVNSTTQYNIGGSRVLSVGAAGLNNVFAGVNAGASTTGFHNSFFGRSAGQANTTGVANSFFGFEAGLNNITGLSNSFFGQFAGKANTEGNNNTIIGDGANVGFGNLTFATAIGSNALVSTSNTIALGRSGGQDTVWIPGNLGIGMISPQRLLSLQGGMNVDQANANNGTLNSGTVAAGNGLTFGSGSGEGIASKRTVGGNQFGLDFYTNFNNRMSITNGGNVGIGTTAPDQLLSVNGNASKVGGGSWAVFSDERLKNVNARFTRGLGDLMRLNPIRFEYKPDNALGLRGAGEYIGFSAQEVALVVPEAVTRSTNGYLQVNNDPIQWTMLNAIKEQQAQIERQGKVNQNLQTQVEGQRREIDELKAIVCSIKPDAAVCKEPNQ